MIKRRLSWCFAIVTAWSFLTAGYGQCRVIRQGTFAPQNKTVTLATGSAETENTHAVILFRTSLRVNTDGAPNSYHPQDLTGSSRAINNICNGVSVKDNGVTLSCARARQVFARFRDNNFKEPAGHRITWKNVIAATTDRSSRTVPCIFQTGEFAGYFGSLTSLKNGLTAEAAGECGHLNQIDQRVIPAFVLPGGQNVVRKFGAAVGDLLVAFNPSNNVVSVAVVGDVGPADKLGEGSVGLNMALLRRTEQPSTYREALRLDTGNDEMLIAIIPGSGSFRPQRPFTKENLVRRAHEWMESAGFNGEESFVQFLRACNR